jgi:hypothetical protein
MDLVSETAMELPFDGIWPFPFNSPDNKAYCDRFYCDLHASCGSQSWHLDQGCGKIAIRFGVPLTSLQAAPEMTVSATVFDVLSDGVPHGDCIVTLLNIIARYVERMLSSGAA